MAKKPTVKRTMVITLEIEAAEGTPGNFFDKLAKGIKKNQYVVDDIYDVDPTDLVENPGEGVQKVKLISVKV